MPDPAMDNAGRLGEFLEKTIKELKPVDEFKPVRPMPEAPKRGPHKFTELAAKLKADREKMFEEADKLRAESDEVMPVFLDAVAQHRSIIADAKAGINDMKEAAAIMSNFAPNESKT